VVFQELLEHNTFNDQFHKMISTFHPLDKIPDHLMEPFNLMGINLTDDQDLCVRLSLHHPKQFLNPGIGIGKTTLMVCYGIALGFMKKKPVIILNTDPNLLFRDFKRLKGLLTDINKAIADSLTAEYF
jgi:hypothetical protein